MNLRIRETVMTANSKNKEPHIAQKTQLFAKIRIPAGTSTSISAVTKNVTAQPPSSRAPSENFKRSCNSVDRRSTPS
ncbi:MAG: hypothetical protein RLZZ253_1610 [Verrucomicrobiota bacterium]